MHLMPLGMIIDHDRVNDSESTLLFCIRFARGHLSLYHGSLADRKSSYQGPSDPTRGIVVTARVYT